MAARLTWQPGARRSGYRGACGTACGSRRTSAWGGRCVKKKASSRPSKRRLAGAWRDHARAELHAKRARWTPRRRDAHDGSPGRRAWRGRPCAPRGPGAEAETAYREVAFAGDGARRSRPSSNSVARRLMHRRLSSRRRRGRRRQAARRVDGERGDS